MKPRWVRTDRIALALAALASPLAAGQVWVVDDDGGPGVDFAQITGAIAAAADGDLILVRAGSYDPFTIDGKSLTVTSAGFTIASQVDGRVTLRGLAAGQTVVLRGLDTGAPAGEGLLAENCAGAVWIEDCNWIGQDDLPGGLNTAFSGARVANCASVALLRCSARGGGGAGLPYNSGAHGLDASGSAVHAMDGSFEGGPGAFDDDLGGTGGDGAVLSASWLFASGCAFTGAQGGGADDDLTFDPFGGGWSVSCGVPGEGGAGLRLAAGAVTPAAYWLDCAFAPGAGGVSTSVKGCSNGGPGLPIDVQAGSANPLNGDARSLSIASPIHEGTTATLRFTGGDGDFAFALVGAAAPCQFAAPFFGSFAIGPPALVKFAGVVPAGGVLLYAAPLPLQPPGVEFVRLEVQSAFFTPAGEIRIGPASSLIVLDQAF